VLKRPSTGNFRFNLVAANGQVIATSLATVLQAALIPVASSVGTDLKAAARAPLDTMVHWDRWEADSAATKTSLPGPLSAPHRGGRECDRLAVVGASSAPWSR
jgi:uncharacterized protein DUF1508